jgi:hypothetical protein
MKWLVCSMAMFLCAGCGSMGRLDGKIKAPNNNESMFVLGLAPDNYRVMIEPGSNKDGTFDRSAWYSAAFYGGPEKGYVVGKTKAGWTLAVTMVRETANATAIAGEDFRPCQGAKTVVFQAPAGKVVYLGNLVYSLRGENLEANYGNDLDGARRFLKSAYPALADHVEQGSYQLLPTTLSCSNTVNVYVSAPR